MDRVGDTIGVLRAGVLVAEQAAGTWRGGGDRSFDAWRVRTSCNHHHHEIHSQDLTITRITQAPVDGPPGKRRRRRPIGEIASVRYELRDPTGRLVSGPPEDPESAPAPASTMATASSAAPGSTDALGGRRTTHSHGGTGPAGDASGRADMAGAPPGEQRSLAGNLPTQSTVDVPVDELDLGWATDPFTGMRVPAFFLSG